MMIPRKGLGRGLR